MLQNRCKFIAAFFFVFLTSSTCFADSNNSILSKLAAENEMQGDSEHRTGVYASAHEDSSTESPQNLPQHVEFRQKSIIVTDINNNIIDLTNLKSKWILINFWASWCEPCVNEIKEFNQILKKHKNDIAIYAVNYDLLSIDEQKHLAKKYAIKYPSLLQNSLHNLEIGDISVVPVTYIFDKQGIVMAKLYGGQTVSSIENKLQELDN